MDTQHFAIIARWQPVIGLPRLLRHALLIMAILLGGMAVVSTSPVSAQTNPCSTQGEYATVTPVPLNVGGTGRALLSLPSLPRFYTESRPLYEVVALFDASGRRGDLTGTSDDDEVFFNVPGGIAPGSYTLYIQRYSNVFDQFGSYVGFRTLRFCNPVRLALPPPPPGPLTIGSAASYTTPVAPDAIVVAYGSNLATTSISASLPLPITLAGTSVDVTDSAGVTRAALLFFVSPGQVNYLMPEGTAAGRATVKIFSGDGKRSAGTVDVATVAPGLFGQNSDGKGIAAANALRIRADGSQIYETVSRFDAATNTYVPEDIDISNDPVYLILYGTGLRRATTVTVRIGGIDVPAQFFGAQQSNVGTDQINVLLPKSLIGRKTLDVQVLADGKTSNVVQVSIQ